MNQYHETSQKSSNPSQESIIPTPPTLYKYCSFNEWTRSIFERNEIYFQSPDCFNDPFDSKISTTYEGTEEQRISRLISIWRKGPFKEKTEENLHPKAVKVVKAGQDIPFMLKTLERSAERIRKQMGIFCMTHKKDNIQMWSHYANKHMGFCLEFQTANDFFGRAFPITEKDYRLDRPCVNLIKPPDIEEMVKALLVKAEDWRYEEEWRIIDHINGPGSQAYPPEALSGVILGCRISPENRHLITQLCRVRNPQPTLYWAEEKDREFGLDIRLINQSNAC